MEEIMMCMYMVINDGICGGYKYMFLYVFHFQRHYTGQNNLYFCVICHCKTIYTSLQNVSIYNNLIGSDTDNP